VVTRRFNSTPSESGRATIGDERHAVARGGGGPRRAMTLGGPAWAKSA
jgi:hypothetical protein